jgi:hypothetical protein
MDILDGYNLGVSGFITKSVGCEHMNRDCVAHLLER